jgi:ADP-ribosyl-[dinitrogen reductase] hydrolase
MQEDKTNIYSESIASVLEYGGDSDTNACIVGGLIGAWVGLDLPLDEAAGIPEEMTKKLLSCNVAKGS